MNDSVFTLTLIKDDKNSKILVTTNETPAKVVEEADAVISKKSLASTYKSIVDAIPNFKDAEDGCEDWVTHTIEEFLDIYDLDLVKVFEDAEEEILDEEGNEEIKDSPKKDLTEKDKTGENTTIEEIEDDDLDEPEFDLDLFGNSKEDTINPEEIFVLTFKPENLQSIKDTVNFNSL